MNRNDNETNLDDGSIPDAIVAASEYGNDDETITVSIDRSSITHTLENTILYMRINGGIYL